MSQVKFIYSNTGVLIGMVQILLPFMIIAAAERHARGWI